MSRLQRYVLWEVLKAFVPAFVVLTLIMTLAFCIQLLNEGLDVVRLEGLPRHIITHSVPLVLPMAFLTGVIMAFGRMAADTEITAIRLGGVHLAHVIFPVLGLALLLSLVAAYFEFQLMPTAQLRTEELKDQAIRQIILDKVVLSAQRQFSFPHSSWYVQYDEFRDGQMRGLLILGAERGIPKAVITARTGRLMPNPERSEFIQIRLQDCLIVLPESENLLGREPTPAAEMILDAKVARDRSLIKVKLKHMALGRLIERVGELRRAVARQPRPFDHPDRVIRKIRRMLQGLALRMDPRRETLDGYLKDLGGLDEEKRGDLSIIEIRGEQLKAFGDEGRLLQSQFVRYSGEIERLQGETVPPEAYPELRRLRLLRDQVLANINSLKAKETAATKEIRDAEARIARHNKEVREKEELVGELERELKELSKKRGQLRAVLNGAQQQSALRGAWLRIHKRLVQAMAVLTFALVGIPLGIMTRRRSPTVAYAISFAVVFFIFYPFLIVGQVVTEAGILPPGPAIWGGNVATLALGLVLTSAVLRK